MGPLSLGRGGGAHLLLDVSRPVQGLDPSVNVVRQVPVGSLAQEGGVLNWEGMVAVALTSAEEVSIGPLLGPELTGTWLGVLSLQRWLWGAESVRGGIFRHSAISLEEGSTHPPPPGVSGSHGLSVCLSAGAVPRLLAGAVGLLGPQHQPLSGPVLPPGAAHPAPGPGDSYCSGPCLGVPWESVQALAPLSYHLVSCRGRTRAGSQPRRSWAGPCRPLPLWGSSWVGGKATCGSGTSACEESSPRDRQLLCGSVPLPYLWGPSSASPSGASAHPSQAGSHLSWSPKRYCDFRASAPTTGSHLSAFAHLFPVPEQEVCPRPPWPALLLLCSSAHIGALSPLLPGWSLPLPPDIQYCLGGTRCSVNTRQYI
ncbi:uncharacterized protein LOC109258413 isoform X1 [Panthera pardus]|uniref:Uncharacterized protein LOC109258413 isoform X1 n=1 Tax=Panthera pardus TaxID=9691 RepID=A0A9W2V172_PANPR|nr:uncharacterized protein LOC109258413 isoform X1 [Panthera pardus]XP_053752363.1 uncharacterized protein LOC109258413 isoform X1 [Panthera pardus]